MYRERDVLKTTNLRICLWSITIAWGIYNSSLKPFPLWLLCLLFLYLSFYLIQVPFYHHYECPLTQMKSTISINRCFQCFQNIWSQCKLILINISKLCLFPFLIVSRVCVRWKVLYCNLMCMISICSVKFLVLKPEAKSLNASHQRF